MEMTYLTITNLATDENVSSKSRPPHLALYELYKAQYHHWIIFYLMDAHTTNSFSTTK